MSVTAVPSTKTRQASAAVAANTHVCLLTASSRAFELLITRPHRKASAESYIPAPCVFILFLFLIGVASLHF